MGFLGFKPTAVFGSATPFDSRFAILFICRLVLLLEPCQPHMDTQVNPRIVAADLVAAAAAVQAGQAGATELLAAALAAADSPACQHVFIRRFDAQARAAAAAIDAARAAGAPLPPLAGLAVSIKDLFDVAGQPTTAGSAAMADASAATADCPAVARLRAAGAALLGHSNLSEFAFSGVGLNPHHGTPVNPVTLALLKELSGDMRRTDLDGAVSFFFFDGGGVKMETFGDADV